MSLRDKAAKIELHDLDAPAAKPGGPALGATLHGSARGRSGVAAITQSISLHHRVQDLEAKLATYEDGALVVHLDPKSIGQSKWKNRHELSFATSEYLELKAEIEASGGNVQPIKVRRVAPLEGEPDRYEVVYGRRRLRACSELGLMVAAVVQDMDDVQLFKEMERENRNREDLSPWEQGVMYRDALESGLFSSQRQIAHQLNISQGNLSVSLKLAALPDEVVAAFPSPLQLQFRWAQPLADVLEKDPASVLTVANELAALPVKLAAKEVLQRLLGAREAAREVLKRDFSKGSKVVGSMVRDAKGALSLKVKAGALTPASEKKLVEFVERLLG